MDAKIRYLESALNGAGPERRLQLLLDGAVQFIVRARKALAEKKLDECHNCTVKAQDIYLELLVALDPEAGEYVANLQGLYYFLYDILLDANVRKSDERYVTAEQIACKIRDMWDDVIQVARQEAMQAQQQATGTDGPLPVPERRLNIAG